MQIPVTPRTPVTVDRLQELISSVKGRLTKSQASRAQTLLHELSHGAHIPLSKPLPPIIVPNTPSVYEHGIQVTDTVGSWIVNEFVAGPFSVPPYRDFRANSMIAIEQKNKVRLVMNLSGPKDFSFNDAVPEVALEKVFMSSAKHFGYSVLDCGENALMSKFDMENAYKNIPNASKDLPLHGFVWLGRYFLETQLPFGSKVAVASFDRLGYTMEIVTAATTLFPSHLRHRTLDDLPIVVPAGSNLANEFCEKYKENCAKIGLKLAPNCPHFEKAFENSTRGTVLGVKFDTTSLQWSFDGKKCDSILLRIQKLCFNTPVSVLDIQQLYGSLTDFSNMCPFLKAFRLPLQLLLTQCENSHPIPPTAQVVTDLQTWAAAVESARAGLPIPTRPYNPHLAKLRFVSDAAGARFHKQHGRFIPFGPSSNSGAASINLVTCPSDDLFFCSTIVWPDSFLYQSRDSQDHAYGCKTATLEVIGLILPFLCIPLQLRSTHVLLLTDNLSLVYGWDSKHLKNDVSASIFIRALHMIGYYLGTQIDVLHLPRNSSFSACLADSLTRKSTTTPEIRASTRRCHSEPPPILAKWLNNPQEDWSFSHLLLQEVINKCSLPTS